MEQIFDSEESSSGCESGWTLYLQHSIPQVSDDFLWKKASVEHEHDHDEDEEEEEEEDDDMSMVSDASSGPPHDFQEQNEDEDEDEYGNNGVFCHPPLTLAPRKRRKILKQTSFHSHRHLQDLHASLDDTASSPFFTFSTKDLKVCNKLEASMEDGNSFDYSQGHSTTYFEMV